MYRQVHNLPWDWWRSERCIVREIKSFLTFPAISVKRYANQVQTCTYMKIRLRTKRMPWRALSPNLWHPSDGLNLPLDWSRITYLVPKFLYDPAVLWEAATKKLHSVSNVFNNRLFFATVLLVDILEFLMSKHNLLFHKEWTQNRNSQNQNKLVTRFGRQLLLFRLTLTNQKAVFTEIKIKSRNS